MASKAIYVVLPAPVHARTQLMVVSVQTGEELRPSLHVVWRHGEPRGVGGILRLEIFEVYSERYACEFGLGPIRAYALNRIDAEAALDRALEAHLWEHTMPAYDLPSLAHAGHGDDHA